jgi:hypothetical protein
MTTGNRLLIIGNGFDLDLGLKTSYKNFIQSDVFLKLAETNELCQHLKSQHRLKNWINIETELKQYWQNANLSRAEFNELCHALKEYLLTLDLKSYSKTSKAFQLIDSIKNEAFDVIDFNYTDTITSIMQDFGLKNTGRHLKIHGSLQHNNIILGIEDSAEVNPEYLFLKKSFNPSFGKGNPFELLEGADEIIFFGLSLGQTDHLYFENYLRNKSDVQQDIQITFYYAGEEDYENLHNQLDLLTKSHLAHFKYYNQVEFISTI